MNKTTNQYINQLNLDPKREAAVRKLVENAGGVNDSTPLVENLVGNELLPIKQDGENKAVSVEQIKNEVINNGVIELPSKYEFVDLGLPSGTKWATCNVGANSPEEAGLYFAWGETEGYIAEDVADGKKAFSWDNYKFGTQDNLTKYNTTDSLTQLELIDDVTYQSDNNCKTPTREDFKELINNTTSTWETLNGVNGRRFTSKTNGNSIFVPAAGVCSNGLVFSVGFNGYLWSSSLNESNPRYSWLLYFYSSDVGVNTNDRFYGFTVRPVQPANTPTTINLKELQSTVDSLEIQAKDAKEVFIITSDMFEETATVSESPYPSLAFTDDGLNKFKEAVEANKIIGINKSVFSFIENNAAPFTAGVESGNYVFSTYVGVAGNGYALSFETLNAITGDIDRYDINIVSKEFIYAKNLSADGSFYLEPSMFAEPTASETAPGLKLIEDYKPALYRAITTNKVIKIEYNVLKYLDMIATPYVIVQHGGYFILDNIITLGASSFQATVVLPETNYHLTIFYNDGIFTADKVDMSDTYILYLNNYSTAEDFTNLKNAIENGRIIIIYDGYDYIVGKPSIYSTIINIDIISGSTSSNVWFQLIRYSFNANGTYTQNYYNQPEIDNSGDGTKFLANDGKYKEAGPVIIEYPLEGTEAVTLTDEQINAAKNSNIKLKLTGDSLDFTAIAIPYSYAISDTMIAIDIRISGTDSNIDQKLVIDIANKTIIRQ